MKGWSRFNVPAAWVLALAPGTLAAQVELRTITFPATVVAEFAEHGRAAVPGRAMTITLGDGIRPVVGVSAAGEYLTVVDGVIIGTGTDAASTEALLSTDVEVVQVLGAETAAADRFGRPLRMITTRGAPARPEMSARDELSYEIGFRSLTEQAERPLIIVDGIVIGRPQGSESGALPGGITPDRIASIEIVKGAAAARLYGERAAGGVIMIRTKK